MNRVVVIAVGVVILLSAWGAVYQDSIDFLPYAYPLQRVEIFIAQFSWYALDGLTVVFSVWFIIEFVRTLIRWASTGSGRSSGKTPSPPI